MPPSSMNKFLLVGMISYASLCFSQSIHLKCDGMANRLTIMGEKSSMPFSTSVELDEGQNYVQIDNLSEIAPGIGFPYQQIIFNKDRISFAYKREELGDFVSIRGDINRFTGDMNIDYTNINPSTSWKILTIKTSGSCKQATIKKF